MSSEDTNNLKFNQQQKCDKAPFIIYANLECLKKFMDVKIILKIHLQQNQVKIFHKLFSVCTISSFKSIENNEYRDNVHKGKNFMKKFCETLGKDARKIIISK